VYHLTDSEVNSLLAFAGHSTLAGELANSVDLLYNGRYTPLTAQESSGERSGKKPLKEDIPSDGIEARAYPNPFETAINFRTPDSGLIRSLVITNVNGEQVNMVETNNVSDLLTWQPSGLSDGIYYYLLTATDGRTYRGKIVHLCK
jgi:hypothetical protein